jgi:hypothetical protein
MSLKDRKTSIAFYEYNFKTINVTNTISLFDSVSVECFCSFWKNDNCSEYWSAELGKYLLVKKLK